MTPTRKGRPFSDNAAALLEDATAELESCRACKAARLPSFLAEVEASMTKVRSERARLPSQLEWIDVCWMRLANADALLVHYSA